MAGHSVHGSGSVANERHAASRHGRQYSEAVASPDSRVVGACAANLSARERIGQGAIEPQCRIAGDHRDANFLILHRRDENLAVAPPVNLRELGPRLHLQVATEAKSFPGSRLRIESGPFAHRRILSIGADRQRYDNSPLDVVTASSSTRVTRVPQRNSTPTSMACSTSS